MSLDVWKVSQKLDCVTFGNIGTCIVLCEFSYNYEVIRNDFLSAKNVHTTDFLVPNFFVGFDNKTDVKFSGL